MSALAPGVSSGDASEARGGHTLSGQLEAEWIEERRHPLAVDFPRP